MHHVSPAKDPARLATLTRFLLVAQGVLALITVAVEALYLDTLSKTTPMAYPSSADVDQVGTWLTLLYNAQLFGLLAGGGLFIAWFHRVYRNLRPLGALELRHGEGWAIGSWFVPIVALVLPFQMAADAWRASDERLEVFTQRAAWQRSRVPLVFLAWWIAFSLYCALTAVASGMRPDYFTLDSDRTFTMLSMGSNVFAIAAAVLGVRVVELLTARQRARAAARERMAPPAPWGPPPPPPPIAGPAWAAPGEQV